MTVRDFDAGSTGGPAGITGPVRRVLVIGAGIAGLTAASTLAQAGVETVLLEARERLGGRLYTADLGGWPTDLGGSWIHTPAGNPLSAFAELAGVPRRSANPLPELAGFDFGEGRRLSAAEVAASLGLQMEGFPAAQGRLLTELGPDATAAAGIEAFVAQAGLATGPARRARQALHALIEAESASATADQSLRWMWHESEYGGDYFGDVPVGGYRRVVEAMAAGLDLRLGVEVTEIARSAEGVRVRCADGRVEEGSHVVVTVPLGVLKRGGLRFSPALPPGRRAAIGRLGFGRYEKVAMRFAEPFWRNAGFPHLMIFPRDPADPAVWAFGQDAFGGGPVLVIHVFHSAAGQLLGMTPDEAVQWARGLVSGATGRPCPVPAEAAVTAWAACRFTGGAYTHIPPGAEPADADLLGEPVGGRLLFAGEHTQSARLAYADGAMASGLREAGRLLGRPAVPLRPHPTTRTAEMSDT